MNLLKFKVAMFISWIIFILSLLVLFVIGVIDYSFGTGLTKIFKGFATKVLNRLNTYCRYLLCEEAKNFLK